MAKRAKAPKKAKVAAAAKPTKKQKLQKTDGLGPLEIKRIRSAVRLVWHRSHARALVVKRCTGKDGFTYCEDCTKRTPKLRIDHIRAVGDVDEGFITRMFVSSKLLRGLCKECHDGKTKLERAAEKEKKEIVKKGMSDMQKHMRAMLGPVREITDEDFF